MNINNFNFSQAKIFVLGDLMLDESWYGSTNRISPEAPVPVVLHSKQTLTLGGAGNVARNIIDLGATSSLSGFVGQDDNAQLMAQLCQESQINNQLICIPQMTTTKKLRILSRNQQLLRVDFEDSKPVDFDLDAVIAQHQEKWREQLALCNVVILSDYLKGTRKLFPYIIKLANELGKPVFIDPKGTDYTAYRHAYCLTPNLSEFTTIALQYGYTLEQIHQEEAQVAQELIHKLDLQALLITKSEQGMTLYPKVQAPYHQHTYAEEVFDVTGAGDTVIATLATAVGQGVELQQACYLANKAAGISVSKVGTSTVKLEELIHSCQVNHTPNELSLQQLLAQVAKARSQGETIVFTNGCFDILHRGHLSYLKKARELGDRLIVGVNSDASVARLKGPTRPVNSASDRMLMLASLKDVDWVIEFTEDTPLELIKAIMPDILVKGGDYQVEDIVGYQEVIANGGKVQTISFVDNYSTTNIINKINKSA